MSTPTEAEMRKVLAELDLLRLRTAPSATRDMLDRSHEHLLNATAATRQQQLRTIRAAKVRSY